MRLGRETAPPQIEPGSPFRNTTASPWCTAARPATGAGLHPETTGEVKLCAAQKVAHLGSESLRSFDAAHMPDPRKDDQPGRRNRVAGARPRLLWVRERRPHHAEPRSARRWSRSTSRRSASAEANAMARNPTARNLLADVGAERRDSIRRGRGREHARKHGVDTTVPAAIATRRDSLSAFAEAPCQPAVSRPTRRTRRPGRVRAPGRDAVGRTRAPARRRTTDPRQLTDRGPTWTSAQQGGQRSPAAGRTPAPRMSHPEPGSIPGDDGVRPREGFDLISPGAHVRSPTNPPRRSPRRPSPPALPEGDPETVDTNNVHNPTIPRTGTRAPTMIKPLAMPKGDRRLAGG